MTSDEQLKLWVEGKSVHNKTHPIKGVSGGECCPDFSCCNPELKARKSERIKFFRATPGMRNSMLMMFLSRMLKNSGMKVSTSKRKPAP